METDGTTDRVIRGTPLALSWTDHTVHEEDSVDEKYDIGALNYRFPLLRSRGPIGPGA